jgi:hypothetical protein
MQTTTLKLTVHGIVDKKTVVWIHGYATVNAAGVADHYWAEITPIDALQATVNQDGTVTVKAQRVWLY